MDGYRRTMSTARPRTARSIAAAILISIVALAAGGCGDDRSDGAGESRASGTTTASRRGGGTGDAVDADLRVQLSQIGSKRTGAGIGVPSGIACSKRVPATCSARVQCPTATDASATARARCAFLARDGERVLIDEAVPKDTEVCTDIYGGAERAVVTGSLAGRRVDARFSRENGCTIARWDAAAPLWDSEAGTPSTPPSSTPSVPGAPPAATEPPTPGVAGGG